MNPAGNSSSSAPEWRWLLLALAGTLPLAVAFYLERQLSCDGACFFTEVVDRHRFVLPTPTRVLADIAQQWVLLLAAVAGVTSMPLLVASYGLGLLLIYWVSLAACWKALPAGKKQFMVLPVWSLLVLHYPMDGHLTHEGHVMAALSWPALFFLARRERWSGGDVAVLLACLAVLSFSYESTVLAAPLFAVLAGWRAITSPERGQRALAWIATGLALLGFVVALRGIFFPVDRGNRDGFLQHLMRPLRDVLAMVGAGGLIVFLIAWLGGYTRVMLGLAGLAALAAACWAAGYALPWPVAVYPLRTLFMTLLFPMLLIGAWLRWREVPLPRAGFVCSAAVMLAFAVALGTRLESWCDYRSKMRHALQTQKGLIVEADASILKHRDCGTWNLPLHSLVWSWPRVQSIVLNHPKPGWEPFDPYTQRPLQGYLTYAPELAVGGAPGQAKKP